MAMDSYGPSPQQYPGNFQGFGHALPSNNDATIFEKRLEHDQIIYEITKVLTGKVNVKEKDGTIKQVQVHKALMNDDGVTAVMSILRSMLNPVTGLTNIDENHASSILEMIWHSLLYIVVLKEDEYEIDRHHKQLIMTNVISVCHCQLYRGVGGHESRNMRTVTQENLGFQENKSSSSGLFSGGSGFNGFGGRKNG